MGGDYVMDRGAMVRAIQISWLSILTTAAFGIVGLILSIVGGSTATLGLSLESFVDVWSSVLVLWRFWGAYEGDTDTLAQLALKEKRASVGIALVFVFISLIIMPQAIVHLINEHHTTDDNSLLWMASCSLVVCVFLCIAKLYLASKLRSPALKKDGITSGAVALLSAGIILSSAVYKKNKSIWWLDSAVAVTVAIVLFIYGGRSLIRNKWYNKEFWSPTELPSSVPGPDGGNAVPLEKL